MTYQNRNVLSDAYKQKSASPAQANDQNVIGALYQNQLRNK